MGESAPKCKKRFTGKDIPKNGNCPDCKKELKIEGYIINCGDCGNSDYAK
jgi:Zn finger protein HypA/HybF involved in hydrogenase expression